MSKAIMGGLILGADLALAIGAVALTAGTGGLGLGLLANPAFDHLLEGIAAVGISMEAGAIADAITSNRGMNITTRQAAAYRQTVYGMQRIGGVQIYQSTTGNSDGIYNMVIVLAGHVLSSIDAIYLDGRQVFFDSNSPNGITTSPDGTNFGGYADGQDHIGPTGQKYNFSSNDVFVEARYGTQSNTDYMHSLQANDSTWAPTSNGVPYLGGCAYIYAKFYYNTNNFPNGAPEIRITVKGKPILDPRTGETAFSSNPALITNDIIIDPKFGLNDATVNQAQLIAAANICDELVPTATAGDESRYTAHWHYDCGTGAGDAISQILLTCAGRLSRIGGQWYIFPGVFVGASLSFNESNLIGKPQWSPTRSYRELFNCVRGTFTAPNFPYNIAGNLYDSNGYYNGQTQNDFAFEWQPTNAPQYTQDALHGYTTNQFLNQDGGVLLVKQLNVPACISMTQIQRLFKIGLMRNRHQGTGTFEMNLSAYEMEPCDTFNMNFAKRGWVNKLLEVNSVDFNVRGMEAIQQDSGFISVTIGANETGPDVYEWSVTEEDTIYAVPAIPEVAYAPASQGQAFSGAPVGAIDGTNAVFTLPSTAAVLIVAVGGMIVSDYTWSGTTLTFSTPPAAGSSINAIGIPSLV